MKFGTSSVVLHRKPNAQNTNINKLCEIIDYSEMPGVKGSERVCNICKWKRDKRHDRI